MRFKLGQFLWQWRIVLVVAPVIAGLVLVTRSLGLLQSLEILALDQFFQWRPQEVVDDRIVLVEVTELDIQKWGWPLDDRTLARMLQTLKDQQPSMIGLDIFRDLPVGEGYDELVKVFETTPNLIGIRKVVPSQGGAVVNPPPTLSKLGQVGANDIVIDLDGRVRRLVLGLEDKDQQQITSLGAELALRFLASQGVRPEMIDPDRRRMQLGKSQFMPLDTNDGGYVNVDVGGYQLLSNFRNIRAGFRSITLTDVLERRFPEPLRDRIVLIGMTAESAGDVFLTPYSQVSYAPILFSGVSIHAEVTSQIISAALDGRNPMQFWPDWAEMSLIITAAFLGACLSWSLHAEHVALKHKNFVVLSTPVLTLATAALLSVAIVGAGYVAFWQGWWIPVMAPVLALSATSLAMVGYAAQLSDKMRQTFGRYLTNEVATELLETREGLKLGGEKCKVTVLISDLRGFSAISERVKPETAVKIINQYLEVMIDIVNQYKGILNEVVGDGLFIFFGAPIQRDDDAQRAIACAIAMQLAMKNINAELAKLDLPALAMGIGLHTGDVLAGNIGSERRAKYTIIGSNVNLASRIEAYSVGGQILASQATIKDAGAIVRVDQYLQVQLKGFAETFKLYELGGIGGQFNLCLPKDEDVLVQLHQVIPIQWMLLEGKHVTNEKLQGQIVQLSPISAVIRSHQPVELLANIKFNLETNNKKASGLGDVYAKIVQQSPHQPRTFQVRFTSVPPEVGALFYYLCEAAKQSSAKQSSVKQSSAKPDLDPPAYDAPPIQPE
ncbi:MAG: adenylate/guanylate cyclase domain-containing protein [Leptolyngbyaceae cyanobacterium bins.349]|nr:adenylate/guanylate cyclase domain-containing protein [Leptolyngbyaceae cyanobacterium bins.349]